LRSGIQPVMTVVLTALVIGIPLWLVLVTSFKTTGEAQRPDLSLPDTWNAVANYRQALSQGEVLQGFLGSLLVTVPTVVGLLLIGSAASWVLARRGGRMIAVLYTLGISGIILPPAAITIVLTLRSLGLHRTLVGMIGVYMGIFMATVLFFITGFIRTIPLELEEAARIDGASPRQVFLRIIVPMLRPVIATATILVTLSVWNEVFFGFFVLGGGAVSTLPLNLYQVAAQSAYVNNWNLIFSYVVLMSLPMLLLFAFAQKRIIAGITSGAVK
jgi:raffinose/stachyose/melibiose transport system permease protein